MKVAVLTSSRADYSIYYPLLREMQGDNFFILEIIAFGTHVSKVHGYTVAQIEKDGFHVHHKIESLVLGDTPEAIAAAMGLTIIKFSSFWTTHNSYDLVFALGDRYEMFAAVAASLPFGILIAHIHGGETTLGAIDDVLRHAITHTAKYHFTTTDEYKQRVIALKGNDEQVYNVGALSIDNLVKLALYDIATFKDKFNIDLAIPSVLITFHPETVSFHKNEFYADELVKALHELQHYQLIITMPNADTAGNMIREKLIIFVKTHPKAVAVESFGTLGYLSCMKYCQFMIGNTSSGFVEASYFPKYVINLGSRQQGRLETENIITVPITKEAILLGVQKIEKAPPLPKQNTYGSGNAAQTIVNILKRISK